MIVRFNEEAGVLRVTRDRDYEVIAEKGDFYSIINDDGKLQDYFKRRFKIIKHDMTYKIIFDVDTDGDFDYRDSDITEEYAYDLDTAYNRLASRMSALVDDLTKLQTAPDSRLSPSSRIQIETQLADCLVILSNSYKANNFNQISRLRLEFDYGNYSGYFGIKLVRGLEQNGVLTFRRSAQS